MTRLEPGQQAPQFRLPDDSGGVLDLADLRGRYVVLYFYPADGTPGCTTEATQFQQRLADLEALGVEVIGCSPDQPERHQRFRSDLGLRFHLVSDPDHTTMERFGAWGEKTLYGKKHVGVIRSTVLVDPDGRVAKAWYNVRANGHADAVVSAVQALVASS
jgi:peroxiredoxin Q/BCP